MPEEPRVVVKVADALRQTFAFDELEALVAQSVNEDVTGEKPATGQIRTYFSNVVRYLNARDLLAEVVIAARKERPRSIDLMKAGEELAVSASARVNVNGQTENLEKAVRDVAQHVDVSALRLSIGFAEQRTGSVEANGCGFGTAFLVGPDRVMTNWHVAEAICDGTVSPSAITIRFDYKRDRCGRTLDGVNVGLAAEWLIHHRPYALFDTGLPPQPDPSPDELDFAILALDRAFGEEDMAVPIFANETRRGWINLSSQKAPPAAGEPIYVLGHPARDPLTVSMGKVLAHVGQGRRIRHDAWSLAGSSGSPVFNGDGDLVGIHHGTEPISGHKAQFNQAIPMSLIVRDCQDAGI